MEKFMNKKELATDKHVEKLHVRVNNFEVSASGRFTILVVVSALLLAFLLV